MNVPVVTLSPCRRNVGHVQRVTGSILSSMGLYEDCVANTKEEYVQKAVALIDKLPHMSVRTKFLATDISKPKEFMKEYEDALISLVVS